MDTQNYDNLPLLMRFSAKDLSYNIYQLRYNMGCTKANYWSIIKHNYDNSEQLDSSIRPGAYPKCCTSCDGISNNWSSTSKRLVKLKLCIMYYR